MAGKGRKRVEGVVDATAEAGPSALISSPISTGGAGTHFEAHVGALFLLLLHLRGVPPILLDSVVARVRFQARQEGWHTDDILVDGVKADGKRRRLAMQVKRSFSMSAPSDDDVSEDASECVKTFQAFWNDFKDTKRFDLTVDRLALVVLRAQTVLIQSLEPLFDCARAADSAKDFFERLGAPGFQNKKTGEYSKIIRKIISQEGDVADEIFWQFLRVLHLLPLDLNSSTSTTEALAKNLVALATDNPDKIGTAQSVWSEMVQFATTFIPNAKAVDSNELRALSRIQLQDTDGRIAALLSGLKAHSEPILNGISETIGKGKVVARPDLVTAILSKLSESQVLLLSGQAGGGKSAIAKRVFRALERDHIVAAFRAEEFQAAHLDKVLLDAQLNANAVQLGALLCGQPRKVFFVESVERLLESDERHAFKDFLDFVRGDPSIKLVLTCRGYSTETVRSALLQDIDTSVVIVPHFSESELAAIAEDIPMLAPVLQKPRIREILQNPYLLDVASRISWGPADDFLVTEESLRNKFWKEVVRRESHQAHSMPNKRHDAFLQLGFRRATTMRPFVPVEGLNDDALQALYSDGLVIYGDTHQQFAAPAHDVLEDWAVVTWIEREFHKHEAQPQPFQNALGTAPAIRRSYRTWLEAAINAGRTDVRTYLVTVIRNPDLPSHFRDDTLIAVLSAESEMAMSTLQSLLKGDDGTLLRKMIHLVRVACKVTPEWLPASYRGVFTVAQGPAWGTIAQAIRGNLFNLQKDFSLLAGFLADWITQIREGNHKPPGWQTVLQVAYDLMAQFNHYSQRENLEKLVSVVMKFPGEDAARLSQLATKKRKEGERDPASEAVIKALVMGVSGVTACAEVPDLVIEVSKSEFLIDSKKIKKHFRHDTVDHAFGLRGDYHHDFFPPSALRGPFIYLLSSHPDKGVPFVIEFINRASEAYARQREDDDSIGSPEKLRFMLPSGKTNEVWCDGRLWGAYRGLHVSPPLFESALRAIEHWLLELTMSQPEGAKKWAGRVLEDSNNAAALAVLCSLSTAYPVLYSDIGLSLLSCPDFIRLDTERSYHERFQHTRFLTKGFSGRGALDPLYKSERERSDNRSHRTKGLEDLARDLQLTNTREAVHKLLDDYRAALPPSEKQEREDKTWRIALHRMDLRRYTRSPEPDGGKFIAFEPTPLEEDLKPLEVQALTESIELSALLSPQNWGRKCYEAGQSDGDWRKHLDAVKALAARTEISSRNQQLGKAGPVWVSMVCVRDWWTELDSQDKAWCLSTMRQFVEQAEHGDEYDRSHSFELRAIGQVASKVLASNPDASLREVAEEALIRCLTSSDIEVQVSAAEAACTYLGHFNPDLIKHLVKVIVSEALAISDAKKRAPARRSLTDPPFIIPYKEIREEARKCPRWEPSDAEQLLKLNLEDSHDGHALMLAMVLLGSMSGDPLRLALYGKLAKEISAFWEKDEHTRSWEQEYYCLAELAKMLLSLPRTDALALCQPLIEVTSTAPERVAELISYLVHAADQLQRFEQFWDLWDVFANECKNNLTGNEWRVSQYQELIQQLFLGNGSWKEGITHWRGLVRQPDCLGTLFASLPPSKEVFEAYLLYLLTIGRRSLPSAFLLLEEALQKEKGSSLLLNAKILSAFETLLQRQIYGDPSEVKKSKDLREAICRLLDMMVDAGSSVCYQMREDFLTPSSGPEKR